MNTSVHSDHDVKGRFKPGNSGLPGRPAGSRPKLHAMFWDDLYAVWKEKGAMVLQRLANEDPAAFAKIAALLVAKDPEARPDGVTIVNVITGVGSHARPGEPGYAK